jgi:hypothetical protein
MQGLPGPRVACILDDRAQPGQDLVGIPIIPPTLLCPGDVDAIVISSDAHEQALVNRCREHFGEGIPAVRLYEGLPAGPYPKPEGCLWRNLSELGTMHV